MARGRPVRFSAKNVSRRRGSMFAHRSFMLGKRAAAGFTLLEVLLAIVVLTGGVTAMAQVFSVSTLAVGRARQETAALLAASSKVEELRGTPWDMLADGADVVGGLSRQWRLVPLAASGGEALVVDVRVSPGGARLLTVRARSE